MRRASTWSRGGRGDPGGDVPLRDPDDVYRRREQVFGFDVDLMWLARYDELKAHLEANGGENPVKGDAAGLGTWIITVPEWTWEGRFKQPTKRATGTSTQPKKPRLIETVGDEDPVDGANSSSSE